MENPLVVFVSSVISGMEPERQAAWSAIQTIPLTRPWLFEFSSASSLPLEESYVSKVRGCDIFVLLLKDRVTDPVKAEVQTAQSARKPLLVFLGKNAPARLAAYARSLRVKYASFVDAETLSRLVAEAVGDELITGYRRHDLGHGERGRIGDFLDGVTEGSNAISLGSGPAVAGKRNVVITGTISGDVSIANGNMYNGPDISDPSEALRIYRRILAYNSRFLSLRGIDPSVTDLSSGKQALSLTNIYISLDTKNTTSVSAQDLSKRQRKQPRLLRDENDTRAMTALGAVGSTGRVVILGDPGSGKSTFVNYLAYCLATSPSKSSDVAPVHLPGLLQKSRIPIVVILRDFMQWMASTKQMIDENNAAAHDTGVLFEELLAFSRQLDAEEQRAIGENLSEEELAVFDLLTQLDHSLTGEEERQVKEIAHDLLVTLKNEKLVLDWRKRQQARAAVRLAIEETLDRLPDSYSKDDYDARCEAVYLHIYESYFGSGRSVYAQAA